MRNWHELIYRLIDTSRLDLPAVVREIEREINECYKFEFASEDEYWDMLYCLEVAVEEYITLKESLHQDRLEKLHKSQEYLLRDRELKEVFSKANYQLPKQNRSKLAKE